jgi:hypothetical protein
LPYALVEVHAPHRVVQEYKYVNVTKIGIDARSRALTLRYSGRIKVFIVDDIDGLVAAIKPQLRLLGVEKSLELTSVDASQVMAERTATYAAIGTAVAVFDVNKLTKRSQRPMPRQL